MNNFNGDRATLGEPWLAGHVEPAGLMEAVHHVEVVARVIENWKKWTISSNNRSGGEAAFSLPSFRQPGLSPQENASGDSFTSQRGATARFRDPHSSKPSVRGYVIFCCMRNRHTEG